MAKILHVFFGTDMRCSQEGLKLVAETAGKKFDSLKPGEMFCFINNAETRIKVLAPTDEADSRGVLGSYMSPHGRIDLDAIQYIPRAFGGSGFDMNKAIKASLEKKLDRGDA